MTTETNTAVELDTSVMVEAHGAKNYDDLVKTYNDAKLENMIKDSGEMVESLQGLLTTAVESGNMKEAKYFRNLLSDVNEIATQEKLFEKIHFDPILLFAPNEQLVYDAYKVAMERAIKNLQPLKRKYNFSTDINKLYNQLNDKNRPNKRWHLVLLLQFFSFVNSVDVKTMPTAIVNYLNLLSANVYSQDIAPMLVKLEERVREVV